MARIRINGSAFLSTVAISIATLTPALAEIEETQLEVIVGNHTDRFTTEYTQPFFNETLAEQSGGKITARTVPYTELGLSGFELMKLLELGTYDISWTVLGYVSGESPISEGIELPGVTSDTEVMFSALDAFRPILIREYGEKFNAKPLFVYLQPQNQVYCNLSDEEANGFSLAALKGKKVRVHSTAYADYAEALGMVPVTMAFPDVVPALERGVLDCAITSPNAAYGYKWGQVVDYAIGVPTISSPHITSVNLDRWNGLNAETQEFLTSQSEQLEVEMKGYTDQLNKDSVACLLDGPCPFGEAAGMTLLGLNEADAQTLRDNIQTIVLGRWAKRCGSACAQEWNDTLSGIYNITMPTE